MRDSGASTEDSAEELLDEARDLFQRVLGDPDRGAVLEMVDRIDLMVDALACDPSIVGSEGDVRNEPDALVNGLIMGRALLLAAEVFWPIELLESDSSSETSRLSKLRTDPDDGNIYLDGVPIAHAPLFE